MYYTYNGEKTSRYETYEQLVNALSLSNHRIGTDVWNIFLDNVGVSAGDKRVAPGMNAYLQPDNLYCPRVYRVYDEDGRSLYDSLFVRDVLTHEFSQSVQEEYWRFLGIRRPFRYYEESAYSEYRRGPVPGTSKRSGHYPYYRSIRTFQEKKLCADPCLAKHCRGRRGKNLPDVYDDISRDMRDRGWKSQSKSRYQWEHNVVSKSRHKHGKGAEVVPTKRRTGAEISAPVPK